ncbi:MAG: MFS transporter, partial [Chloroflexota bacterium]
SAVDLLTLIFIARILSPSPSQLSFLDSLSSFATIFTAVAFGWLAGRMVPSRPTLAISMVAAAISILIFATSSTLWMANALAFLVGLFTALPPSIAPWILSLETPRSKWGEAYSKLATAGALGGVIGVAVSFGFLTVAQRWPGFKISDQALVLLWGIATLVAAAASLQATAGSLGRTNRVAPRLLLASSKFILNTPRLIRQAAKKSGQPLVPHSSGVSFRDVWVVYTVAPAILFLGMGMSYTGTLLYLFEGMKSPGPLLFALLLLYRVASWLASAITGGLLNQFTPLRINQAAGAWRIIAVIGLSLLFLLPHSLWSVPVVFLLFSICGAAGGVLGITGVISVTDTLPKRHHGTAIFLFNGASNAGAGVGAWTAGIIGQELGFAAVLALSGMAVGFSLWLLHRY